MYVCMYVYIYTYIHTYIHTYIYNLCMLKLLSCILNYSISCTNPHILTS